MIKKKTDSVENVKQSLYDINIPYFKFPSEGEKFNNEILSSVFGSRIGGDYDENLDGVLSVFLHDFRGVYEINNSKNIVNYEIWKRIIPFFYSESLDWIFLYKNQHLKLWKPGNDLSLIIETVDEFNVGDILDVYDDVFYSDNEKHKQKHLRIFNMPRFRKLCRLRCFNDFIIKTCLWMLHLFYWIDFKNNITNKKNINEYINRVINITLTLKEMLYEE